MTGDHAAVPADPLALFCARLRRLQKAAGILQTSLARATRLSTSQMSDILNGKIKRPPDWDITANIVRACVDHASRAGRSIPPDLRDVDDWRRRYGDLEQDYDTAARPRQDTPAGYLLAQVSDPFALEVHQPVQPDSALQNLPMLPPYVPREHDTELERAVQAAAEGSSKIAVLVGGSSTGKTRACWEALRLLRDQRPGWRLWHPINPSRPYAALRELPNIGPRTVVWLNDAHFYLDAPRRLGERVAAGFRELLRDPTRRPVLVLATMWPSFWSALTVGPAGDTPDIHAQARLLLSGHDISVPTAFTTAQLRRLVQTRDPRLIQAAKGAREGLVTQYVAGAPELLARYRNAPPAAAALMNAAIDARRLGMRPALPSVFLEAAAPGYLTDAELSQLVADWPEDALAYTSALCKGIPGPLTRIRSHTVRSTTDPPQGQTYKLADYLEQHGRSARHDQVPPETFWTAAASYADPGELTTLGHAALNRGRYRDAVQLYKHAAAYGDISAASDLLLHLHGLHPGDQRPARWIATHAPVNDLEAVARLLIQLRAVDGGEEAIEILASRTVAHVSLDNPLAVARLLAMLREADAGRQVAALLARDPAASVSLQAPEAVTALADELRNAGAEGQVAALTARVAAEQVDFASVLSTLRKAGAEQLVLRWVAIDNPVSVSTVLGLLREAGADDIVAALLARNPAAHVSLDGSYEVAGLMRELQEVGAKDQIAALATRVAEQVVLDDPSDVARLLHAFREAGAMEQIAALLARDPATHVAVRIETSVIPLLEELQKVNAEDQVAALAARAHIDDPNIAAGLMWYMPHLGAGRQVIALVAHSAARVSLADATVLVRVLSNLRAAGAEEQIAALLARDPASCVSLGNPRAAAMLLGELRRLSAGEQLTALATRIAAECTVEDPFAAGWLLEELRTAGAVEQFTTLATRAAAHARADKPDSVDRLLYVLHEANAEEQLITLSGRAAAAVSVDAPSDVAWLLCELRKAGAVDQIATLIARDPAAHVSINDSSAVASLLGELREAGAVEQIETLIARDPAAHVSVPDVWAMARLIREFRKAGAIEQALALATRTADYVPLEYPGLVAELLDELLECRAAEQRNTLIERLPGAGMIDLFFEHRGHEQMYRFGREAHGEPAVPWNWDDLI